MKVFRYFAIGCIVTLISFGYVYQRVEIIKTGYMLQKNRKHLSYLIDQNSKLMYNLSKLESPGYLLASLDGVEIEFADHRGRQQNGYLLAEAEHVALPDKDNFVGRLLDLFTPNAEAKPRK